MYKTKTITTKVTDLMLVRSPYFFVLFHQRARTCWLWEPQRLARCLNPGPPTTNWGCRSLYAHTEHRHQSLYQDFHPLPSMNCHHSRFLFALWAFQKLGSLHRLHIEIKLVWFFFFFFEWNMSLHLDLFKSWLMTSVKQHQDNCFRPPKDSRN